MTDPRKSTLCAELEKNKADYVHPSDWVVSQTGYMVDGMALLKTIVTKPYKTFGDFIQKGVINKIESL